MFCNAIEMFLSEVCDIYLKANNVTKFVSGKDFDSVFCFLLGNGLRLAFPALRLYSQFSDFVKISLNHLNGIATRILKPLQLSCFVIVYP